MSGLVVIVPVKDTRRAKARLQAHLSRDERTRLALTMLEDVLEALGAQSLAPCVVVTPDASAARLAERYNMRVMDDASDGHTQAVMVAAHKLQGEGAGGFLTVPADIPLATGDEIKTIIETHQAASSPAFTIVPSHDAMGSNAIACSPVDAVPIRFGDDSFRPHVAQSRRAGISPGIVRLPGIAEDIDTPADLERVFHLDLSRRTRTYRLLLEFQRNRAKRVDRAL
ncbi:MAG: 2-phospho-L-lactate guanylyltransferase [Hyphomicrobiaceae bacterium]